MKIQTRYICELCNRWYSDKAAALLCEAKGVAKELPRGLIFMDDPGDFYDGKIAFAIYQGKPDKQNKHQLDTSLWACRDTPHGDSIGSERCSGCGPHRLEEVEEFKPEWRQRPPMKRMITYLRQSGIEPYIRINNELVPLNVHLAKTL